MRRFRFRLSRLERLRDVRRRQARARVAQALGQVRDAIRERERREDALAESLTVNLPETGPLDVAQAAATVEWREGLRRRLRHTAVCEREARERARKTADEHALLARDHRVLERLRERQHARWLDEAEKEERKFLDEMHRTTGRRVTGGDDA